MIKYHNGHEFDIRYDPLEHKYWLNRGDKLGEDEDLGQIPSVTRIIDSCFPKHLTEWAAKAGADAYLECWNQNLEVQDRYDLIVGAYKKIGEEAANIGSRVHNWLHQYITEAIPEKFESPEGGEKCIDAFLEWEKTRQVKWEESERLVFQAARAIRYAGTADALAEIDGKKFVIDFKTSKKIYKSYYLQVAAYAAALNDELGLDDDNKYQGMILRLDKETGKFQEKAFDITESVPIFWVCIDLKEWNSKRIPSLKYGE